MTYANGVSKLHLGHESRQVLAHGLPVAYRTVLAVTMPPLLERDHVKICKGLDNPIKHPAMKSGRVHEQQCRSVETRPVTLPVRKLYPIQLNSVQLGF